MNILKITVMMSLVLIFNSCSVSEKTTKKVEKKVEIEPKENVSELNLRIDKNVGWVNLMPGSKPKFHVSGKLTLLKGDSYDNERTVLKYIKIYQAGKEMYFINPKVREEYTAGVKTFSYSTIRGLSLNQELNTKKPVNFDFIFNDGNKEFIYTEKNIIIEEVH